MYTSLNCEIYLYIQPNLRDIENHERQYTVSHHCNSNRHSTNDINVSALISLNDTDRRMSLRTKILILRIHLFEAIVIT